MAAARRRRGQRGSALVLAILVMLAMLGLGLMAMRSTTQNVQGTGNLRLSKQARYLAEMGLYHAVTLMNRNGGVALTRRAVAGSRLELRSPAGADANAELAILGPDGARLDALTFPAPAYFRPGPGGEQPPAPLGQFGPGLVPSYRVTIERFTPAPPRPGTGIAELAEANEQYCLMHFTARGYIADRALPTPQQLAQAGRESLFAESSVSAEVVLGPFAAHACDL